MQMIFLLMTVGNSRKQMVLVMVSVSTHLSTGLMLSAWSLGLPHL